MSLPAGHQWPVVWALDCACGAYVTQGFLDEARAKAPTACPEGHPVDGVKCLAWRTDRGERPIRPHDFAWAAGGSHGICSACKRRPLGPHCPGRYVPTREEADRRVAEREAAQTAEEKKLLSSKRAQDKAKAYKASQAWEGDGS